MAELLERESDLAAVRGSLARWREQRAGGVVLIEGPPGIGKTALMAAALDGAATDGLQVLRARGSELEAVLTFGGVRQLFTRHLRSLDDEVHASVLSGPAGL